MPPKANVLVSVSALAVALLALGIAISAWRASVDNYESQKALVGLIVGEGRPVPRTMDLAEIEGYIVLTRRPRSAQGRRSRGMAARTSA